MIFSSIDFIFKFLPLFLFFYSITPGKWKNFCILAGSLAFYLYGVREQPLYAGLLALSVLVNFRIGTLIGRRKRGPIRRRWLLAGVLYNLFWLFLFKYAAFFAQNINILLEQSGIEAALLVYEPAFPLGFSFYTFQAISYLADVYRRETPFERSAVNFGAYFTMFPHLVSGPIVTYPPIRRQLTARSHSFKKIENGLREFTIGLGLKVLLANQLGSLWSQVGTIGYESISTPLAWMGLVAYSLQIYFDFHGYSMMAKGLGLLLGFSLPDNFDHPYMALSMTEFWRKWHITLGSWFREYLYIPLGGNRGGKIKTIRNLAAVWILTGFWHGASWNFLLWGLLLFVLISVEKLGLIRILESQKWIGHLYMMAVIPLSWLFFAVADLGQIMIYLQRLFPFFAPEGRFSYFEGDFLKYGELYGLSMIAGMVFMTDIPKRIYERYRDTFLSALVLLCIFWVCVYCMKKGMDDTFLYFRF